MATSNYKQFQILTVYDALLALNALVSLSISNLEKFDEYTVDAMELLDKYADFDTIPGKEYDDVHDKALFRQRELLAIMADEAKDVFSYRTLRKWLMAHEVQGKVLITRQLEQDVVTILNELHQVRNWTFHNVQSHLVAEKEVLEKQAEEARKMFGLNAVNVTPQLNPMLVYSHKKYNKDMLDSFIKHNLLRAGQFGTVLDEMKKDYQDVYDLLPDPQIVLGSELKPLIEGCKSIAPVKILVVDETPSKSDISSDIASLSMAIQKKRYDGSEESFKKNTTSREFRFDGKDEKID